MPVETKKANGLGVAGAVIGILCILGSWVPVLNLHIIPGVILGGVLALVGFFVALGNGKSGVGWPIAGMFANAIAFGLMMLVNISTIAFLKDFADEARAEEDRKRPARIVAPAPDPFPVDEPILTATRSAKARVSPPKPNLPIEGRQAFNPVVEEPGVVVHDEEDDKRIDRAATLLQMGKNLEKAGKPKAALENYRKVVAEFGDTPSSKPAAERVRALTGK